MAYSDEELMLRCKEGDMEALQVLVRRYRAKITRYANYLLGNEDDAKDIAQETFLRVLKAAKTYTPTAKFATYLYKIASNLCCDELRKRSRRPLISLDDTVEYGDDEDAESVKVYETIADPKAVPPDRIAQQRESEAVLKGAMETLSDAHRQIVEQRTFEELPYARIAEDMAISEGTAKSRMHYATKRLREDLLELFDPEDLLDWSLD